MPIPALPLKSLLLHPLLLLAGIGVASATDRKNPAESTKPFLLNPAFVSLTIGADGTPSNASCTRDTVPEICSLLLRAVPTWKFSPGLRGGVPVAMDSALSLSLVAVPKPGGFGVQATFAWLNPRPAPTNEPNGALESRRNNPPRYPPEAMRRGKTAVVILELWRQPDSEFPRVGKIWIDGKPVDRKNDFVAATLDAVAKWKVEPGLAEQLSYCVPVEYSLGGDGRAPPKGSAPCEPTYVEGFAPPRLLTDVTTAKL